MVAVGAVVRRGVGEREGVAVAAATRAGAAPRPVRPSAPAAIPPRVAKPTAPMSVRRASVAFASDTSFGSASCGAGPVVSVMQGTYREQSAPSTADRHLLAGLSSLQTVLRDFALLEEREGRVDDQSEDQRDDCDLHSAPPSQLTMKLATVVR